VERALHYYCRYLWHGILSGLYKKTSGTSRFAFCPQPHFQFGLKNNILASIDILLVLATLIWALALIYPHIKWIALANTPYLLWVCIATVLQLTITWLNK